ncbi:MAG TPA: DUF1385 domain-containing protein [Gaiellaceae bacterium]
MDSAAAFLTQFEESNTSTLPRLGGMARANGVVMVSERYWAFAGTDGTLREGRMPVAPRSLRAIPLARGLVRLSGSLSPLFKREGVARGRERFFLIAAIIAPLVLAFAPNWLGLTAGFVTTFALLGWLLRGRTLYLHGAEHRAIAALEQRRLRETWKGTALPTRISVRCGTNFAALLMPVAIFGGRFWPLPPTAFTPVVVSVLSLALTMELWQLVQSLPRLARVILLPGLALQRLTTREPRLDETRIALTALAAVLRRELAHG